MTEHQQDSSAERNAIGEDIAKELGNLSVSDVLNDQDQARLLELDRVKILEHAIHSD
jgi:hypothetical protein